MSERPGRRLPTPVDSAAKRWAPYQGKKPDVLAIGQDEAGKIETLLQMLQRLIDGKAIDVDQARALFADHHVTRLRDRIDTTNLPTYTD